MEEMGQWLDSALSHEDIGQLTDGIFGASPYLSDLLVRYPEVFRAVIENGPERPLSKIIENLNDGTTDAFKDAMTHLRDAKAQASLIIGLADLSNLWSVVEVIRSLSELADACVSYAVRTLLLQAHNAGHLQLPDPEQPQGRSGYAVLAMGKLGAFELNYSSDIDLFVFFDEDVFPYVGKKSPNEFAVTITKDLVRLLHERIANRYVFRTDLRLRPDPGSTAIAVSREAAQIYYESYGQNWERAAFIKARPIAGDKKIAEGFLKELQPFIWRKSLDFYAIQDIQSIKRQIYAHKGGSTVEVAGHNIKLGRGGIREIEFYAQIQQLIWGGRFPEARVPQTLAALFTLANLDFVAQETLKELSECYLYLRKVEHRLQMIADEQTQTLPAEAEKLEIFAAFMGYDSLGAFSEELTGVLKTVEKHYALLFEDSPTLAVEGNLVFTGTEDDPDTVATLTRLGFHNPSMVIQTVRTWHHGRYRSTRSDRARQLLTEIMPNLLSAFGKTNQPDTALLRFDRCLAALHAGVPILSVFYSNPQLLELVGEIMGDAPRLADHLSRRPALLDYVLEPDFYRPIGDLKVLADDLNAMLEAAGSFEDVLDICRRWANDQRFRVGVQCMRNILDPIIAAEHLSDVAEAVILKLTPIVINEFERQFGNIEGGAYALVAYGKLGSRELTPTSDLDLIAIYDADLDAYSAGGAKSLPASAYYIRLTQRLVTAFTSLTQEGVLYELDLRLRPNGDKGPLASSLLAFDQYQGKDAWTWEHMALTRARVVFDSNNIEKQIGAIISRSLSLPRDSSKLLQEVASMRARMRKEQKPGGEWDVKKVQGGLIDCDFVVQFLLLKYPQTQSQISDLSGLLDKLVALHGLKKDQAKVLLEGTKFWSRLQFMLRLTTEGNPFTNELSDGLKDKLVAAVGEKTFEDLENKKAEVSESIYQLFQATIGDPSETS